MKLFITVMMGIETGWLIGHSIWGNDDNDMKIASLIIGILSLVAYTMLIFSLPHDT